MNLSSIQTRNLFICLLTWNLLFLVCAFAFLLFMLLLRHKNQSSQNNSLDWLYSLASALSMPLTYLEGHIFFSCSWYSTMGVAVGWPAGIETRRHCFLFYDFFVVVFSKFCVVALVGHYFILKTRRSSAFYRRNMYSTVLYVRIVRLYEPGKLYCTRYEYQVFIL